MNVHESIRNFIVDNFLFGEDSGLTNDTSFLSEGIVDSTGILELVAFLESEWGIRVGDEELIPDNLDSISRVAAFIQRKEAGGFVPPVMLAGQSVSGSGTRQAAS